MSTSSTKRTEPRLWRLSMSRLIARCSAVRLREARRRRSIEISRAKARSISVRLCLILIVGAPLSHRGLALGALVDLDEAQVVRGDLLGSGWSVRSCRRHIP